MNIVSCPKCKTSLIAEELDSHVCASKRVESVWWSSFDGFKIYDGEKWYRWFPSPDLGHRDRITGEGDSIGTTAGNP
jgi:hypothetical protein